MLYVVIVLHLLLAVEVSLVTTLYIFSVLHPAYLLCIFGSIQCMKATTILFCGDGSVPFYIKYITAVEGFLFFICFHDRCYSCTCSLCDEPLFSTRKSECLNGSWHDLCTATSTKTGSTSSYIYMYHKTTKFGLCQMPLHFSYVSLTQKNLNAPHRYITQSFTNAKCPVELNTPI